MFIVVQYVEYIFRNWWKCVLSSWREVLWLKIFCFYNLNVSPAVGKSIQLYTEIKSEYHHFDEIKDKAMLKNNRLITKAEDSDLKICLYQSSIGTGLKPVPKVDRVLVQLMLSQKSIDFWYS